MTSYEPNSYETTPATYQEPAAPAYFPKGKAITCMIMGITSVAIWWYPFIFSIPCIVFGIVALVLAGGCQDAPEKFRGMVKAGRITGIIGLILSIIWTLLFLFLIAFAAAY